MQHCIDLIRFFTRTPIFRLVKNDGTFSIGRSNLKFSQDHHLIHWCVCVCVYVFMFFHRKGFFRLQDVQGILKGTDQRYCVVNISWVLSVKFHHLRIWKCHISPPKTKTPADSLLERKRSCVVNISWVLSAEFHHLCIWKCHNSPPKTKTPADSLLERKQYDIMCSTKRW